jgi:hypothetical protein
MCEIVAPWMTPEGARPGGLHHRHQQHLWQRARLSSADDAVVPNTTPMGATEIAAISLHGFRQAHRACSAELRSLPFPTPDAVRGIQGS